MAKKSKTQRAKASAARQQRKAARENVEVVEELAVVEEEEKPKKFSLKKSSDSDASADSSSKKITSKNEDKTKDKPAKKSRFQFFRDVKSEMKRVTWPSRTDVLQWSGVVVVALIFFGVFVAVLDNVVITPLLILWSGIGG